MVKVIGGGGRVGRAGVIASSALRTMMPASNLEAFKPGRGGGLVGATVEGEAIDTFMFNPRTGTLVVGAAAHADLKAEYAPGQNYDHFVKGYITPRGISIDVERYTARTTAEAWNMAFRAARALRSGGLPKNTVVSLESAGRVTELGLGEV